MSDAEPTGCPCCDWSGEVARTHDYTHRYYTHVIIRDGEIFQGKTCSQRTKPKRSLLGRLFEIITPDKDK